MMNYMKNWKLTKKFLVAILLALVAVFSIMMVVLSLHEKKILVAELNKKGNNLVKFLSGISAEPILSYNFGYLENYVADISKGDKDVAYVVILDKDGNPLTHQLQEPKNKRGLIEHSSPVVQGADQIGAVKMLLSTTQVSAALRNSQIIIFFLSIITMGVISLIVYLLFRLIALRPVESLKAVIGHVAAGDLSQSVP